MARFRAIQEPSTSGGFFALGENMKEYFEIGDLVVDRRGRTSEVVGFGYGSGRIFVRYEDGGMNDYLPRELTHYRPTPEQVAHEKALEAVEHSVTLFPCVSSRQRDAMVYAIVHAAVLDVMADE